MIWSILAGRFLLGLYFLLPGLMKFVDPERHIGLMELHGMPMPEILLPVAGVANVVAGLLLITGRHVRLTALGSVLYIVLVNGMLHDFWNFEGVKAAHEMQNFVKNLGILAGLLVLAGASPNRPLTVSGIFKSDKAMAGNS